MRKDWIVKSYDVVVVGAGASGIPSAIGAAREGVDVLLVEEDLQPGGACVDQYVGMICDSGRNHGGVFGELQGSLMRDFSLVKGVIEKSWSPWFLPSDYLRVVSRLLRSAPKLELLCGATRCLPLMAGSAVAGVVVRDAFGRESRIPAKVVVDATGSAEIAALAGCETRYGRESRDEFDEAPAPETADEKVQLCTWQYISQNLRPANRFNMEGVKARPMESGYGWLPATDERAWERNAGIYLHWGCRVRCDDTRDPVAVAQAQWQALALMEEDHDILRANGYAVHLAPKLGIRESRRLVGDWVITANHLIEGVIPEDTIFVTERGMDVWTEGKSTMAEYPPTKPYGIPYRALLPRDVDGLLVVGKAISGTHLAMSAYRTQNIVGYVGQAGGVAAAWSAKSGQAPRELAGGRLREILRQAPHAVCFDHL